MPGDRLLRFVRRWFDKGTVAIVFEPLVADWQREYQAALGWRRGACLVRGYAALVQSIGIIGSRAVAREALTPIGRDLAWQSARTAAGIVVFIGVVFTAFIRVASGEYPPAFGILVVSTPAILLMWLRNIWAREYGSLRARILDFLKLTALLGVVVVLVVPWEFTFLLPPFAAVVLGAYLARQHFSARRAATITIALPSLAFSSLILAGGGQLTTPMALLFPAAWGLWAMAVGVWAVHREATCA